MTTPLNPLTQLRSNLAEAFSNEELDQLCFALNIQVGEIEGQTLTTRAQNLVSYCQRHSKTHQLIAQCKQLRSTLTWDPNHRNIRAVSSQLPRRIAHFIPRVDIQGNDFLDSLIQIFSPPKQAIVALWGEGGIGKTALSICICHELVDKYDYQVVWVNTSRSDFTHLALFAEILAQLGHREAHKILESELREAVCSMMTRETLLVIDNFEVVGAEEQSTCLKLVTDLPCSVLIVSRERPNCVAFPSILTVPLGNMQPNEVDCMIDEIAKTSINTGRLTPVDRERVIRQSGSNPLAIRWILAQIADGDSPKAVLDELANGKGAAAERVFDRSFNLPKVGPDGQLALLALSLFAPSTTREALAEVTQLDYQTIRRVVKQLVTLNLARSDGERVYVEGLTRSLALVRLNQSGARELKIGFVKYFVNFTFKYNDQTPIADDILEAEKDNLAVAIDLAHQLGLHDDAHSILIASRNVIYLRGHWLEMRQWLTKQLALERRQSDSRNIAITLTTLGVVAQDMGQLDEAERYFEESHTIDESLGNKSGVARNLHYLGVLAHSKGYLDKAHVLHIQSLEIRQSLNDDYGIARSLHQLGRLAHDLGNLNEAHALHQEALRVRREINDQRGISRSLQQLARLDEAANRIYSAWAKYEECLRICVASKDASGIVRVSLNMGKLAFDDGRLDAARKHFNQSKEIAERLGDQSGIARALHMNACLAVKAGDFAEAKTLFSESLTIKNRLHDVVGKAITYQELGRLFELSKDWNAAKAAYEEALQLWRFVKSPEGDKAQAKLECLQTSAHNHQQTAPIIISIPLN